MPTFAVTRHLPGLTTAQLSLVRRALQEATRLVTADGAPVRYLRSTRVPVRNECLCLFRAQTLAAVTRADEIAHISFHSIDEALDTEATAD